MKNFNFINIFGTLINVIKRFPGSILIAFALFILLVIWIACDHEAPLDKHMAQLMATMALGFSLSVSLRLFIEQKDSNKRWNALELLVVAPLMVLYYFFLPSGADWLMTDTVRYIVLAIVSLLLIGVAPYFSIKNAFNFWQYNVKVWWRFLFTLLCTGIFYGGLALALLAFEKMFNIHVDDNCYGYLAAFFYALFAPAFFLAGVPSKYETDENLEYPFLKILGQYILMPILIIYLLILYAYGLKILISWELPTGWLTWLTLIYSGVGLLTYFLLHRLYLTNDNRGAVLFGKYFFFSEIPLIILMFIAILRRVSDYGITENRYFILLIALWMLGITVYMLLTKGKSFRPVLLSLAIIGLLSVVGPWNAFNISTKSQYKRLEKLLTENGLLQDGKYQSGKAAAVVDSAAFVEIKEIVTYFSSEKNVKDIQPLFAADISKLKEDNGTYYFVEILFDSVKMNNNKISFNLYEDCCNEISAIDIAGYDYLITYNYYMHGEGHVDEEEQLGYSLKNKGAGIIELVDKKRVLKQFDLNKMVSTMVIGVPQNEISYKQCSIERLSFPDGKYKIIFNDLSGNRVNDSIVQVASASMYILMKK